MVRWSPGPGRWDIVKAFPVWKGTVDYMDCMMTGVTGSHEKGRANL